jgi:hypothetical protein
MFVLHNGTEQTINYRVKWGNNGEWKNFSLQPNQSMKHWHTLKDNRAPKPYVEYPGGTSEMQFGQVGFAGYGKGHVDYSAPYEFSRSGGRIVLTAG